MVEVPLIWILWFGVKLTPQGFDFCFELIAFCLHCLFFFGQCADLFIKRFYGLIILFVIAQETWKVFS